MIYSIHGAWALAFMLTVYYIEQFYLEGQLKVKRKHQKAAAKEKPATEPRRTGNKSELEAEPKIEPKVEPKIGPKVEPKIEPKVEPENEPKAEPKTELKETEPKVESNAGQIEKTSETASGQDARTLRIDEDGIDVEVSVDGEPSEIVHIPAELGQALKLSLIAEEKKKAALLAPKEKGVKNEDDRYFSYCNNDGGGCIRVALGRLHDHPGIPDQH
ncbi:MAG: hypothetical protein B6245_21270 [Desulfobacteraceae bacterium 4572_88]|nr:MAG: hypothetical protein B6245_21270 [Desulfobacteraceae bacterium 4572_88]